MANRLAAESSPYLRQHRDNPVDWHPWGPEALELARTTGKPILLSIGYSACHWCHVMAHESFEDDETARVMNALYVNVKVDREERPDLDRVYQLAHQALQRRGGGWPLTVFLTPDDLMPFYAGTYFPNEPKHGMPPFVHVLEQVREWYDHRLDQVREQNAALKGFLDDYWKTAPASGVPNRHAVDTALARLEQSFDRRWGGFGPAPKFPHAGDLELLVAESRADAVPERARAAFTEMVRVTLDRMAEGGIHDQLGGGFCRYSVDARWEIPHFEKMLYDNAQLLAVYASAAAEPHVPRFAAVARGIVDWLVREMRHPGGGFFAALDADSEGEEGRFYVWKHEELALALTPEELEAVELHFGFHREPNFEDEYWNPIVAEPAARVAELLGIEPAAAADLLASAYDKLLAVRARRVRPGLDDKVLTSWNALLASALFRAARQLGVDAWATLARECVDFLRANAFRDGRLHAAWKDGVARFPAYLDDHAFLLDALVESLATEWRDADLALARTLADTLLERFEDRDGGGFFFTAHDHEALIARQKPFTDEALPSGNGVAARALQRLGHLVGETRWVDAATRTLKAASGALEELPHACMAVVLALREHLAPPAQTVVRADAAELAAWSERIGELRRRGGLVFVVPPDAALAGLLAERRHEKGGVAYVCEGLSCREPVREPRGLQSA